jgi:hypothetical protein
VLQLEVLIRELRAPVDRRRARAIAVEEVPALDHEALNLTGGACQQSTKLEARGQVVGDQRLTTRWNLEPLYPRGRPRLLRVSPVQNWRKFSAVLGVMSLKTSILMRPRGSPA